MNYTTIKSLNKSAHLHIFVFAFVAENYFFQR